MQVNAKKGTRIQLLKGYPVAEGVILIYPHLR